MKHFTTRSDNYKFQAILLAVFLSAMPAYAQFESDEPAMMEPSSQTESSSQQEMSAPDHRGDDAFLRRYSGKDEVDQLMISAKSRIQRRLDLSLDLLGNVGGGDNAPFWFTSNRQGLSPTNSSGIMLDLGLDGGMRLPSRFYFNYGMEVAVAANYQSDFYLQQAYIEAGYKWFDLSIGEKERWGELINHNLSSGALTWSGNSRPIPQIRLEVPEFTRLGILGRLVSLKGHIAYGWYQDSNWRAGRAAMYSNPPQYTDKILHHSKSFFIRIGDAERFPLEFTAGLESYAQFGGTRHNMRTNATDPIVETYEYPHDFKAYANIFLPINRPGEQTKDNGNTLGSWHLAFDLTMEKWKYHLYYEHFYEDHSSMLGIEYKPDANGEKGYISYGFKRNWMDCLLGFELNAPDGLPFKDIVFEVLNTRGQCGPILLDRNLIVNKENPIIKEGVDGRDDMYSHTAYKSYSHYGYSNGSPVLVSPLYNKDGNLSFRSNRVLMFHLGIDGAVLPNVHYRILATHTAHWGTYAYPSDEKEHITSVLLECFYHLKKSDSWRFGVSIAADFSTAAMLDDNKGIMLTVSKIWKML